MSAQLGKPIAETSRLSEAHLAMLGRFGGRRGQQALALVAAGQLVVPLVKQAVTRVRRRAEYTISVEGGDDIYPDLHEWVLERLPADDRRSLIASTGSGNLLREEGSRSKPPQVHLRYDGSREHAVSIDGHKVTVAVSREEIPGGAGLGNWRMLLEKITFTASTTEGRDAVVRTIARLAEIKHAEPGPPPLSLPSRWGGGWNRRRDLPERTLDSVVLKSLQLERLVDDLATFLAAEETYNRLCQPWHRGYLFYGSPGTGKTSVARALANHFDMPTYYLPLGDLSSDADLMSLVGAIEPRSMLLLEDVDVFHASKERSDEKEKTSVAAMLNALDGVWTPHGLVTVMTTNDRAALDPALLRPGRIDVDEEFTPLDHDQAMRLAAHFGVEDIDPRRFDGQSPASLIEALRRQSTTEGVTT